MKSEKLFHSILVTGGGGYVGACLIPRLISEGYRVTVLDLFIYGEEIFQSLSAHPLLNCVRGDLRDRSLVHELAKGQDAVIHLACISNDPSFELDAALGKSINYDAFEPLVVEAKEAGVKRFIYASSSSVYGVKEVPNVTEDMPLEPLTDYSKYKMLCEQVLARYESPDFTTVTIRPATVCGYSPRQRMDLTVNILTNHAVNNRKIRVFGGEQKRPNIHIQDMVDLYLQLLQEPAEKISGKIYNAGYENHTVSEIAEMVKSEVESRFPDGGPVSIVTETTNDNRSYHISSEKIKKELGFVAQHSIRDAVADLCLAKVMGASAYGNASKYEKELRQLIDYDEQGNYELDLRYFDYFNFDTPHYYSGKFLQLFGEARLGEELTQRHYDLAAGIQRITEDYLLQAVNWLKKETQLDHLALSGGCMMNCLANGKITTRSDFKEVYIPFAPDDSGNAIGAAAWLAQKEVVMPRPNQKKAQAYWGDAYDDAEIDATLKGYGLKYQDCGEGIVQRTATLLTQGKIVGWFQGRMEFGQRALGNRSILADPRNPEMKDHINRAVKFREGFRPFAPAILQECLSEYFDVPANCESPYMERAFVFRNDKRSQVPAVVHEDGTGRVQTVSQEANAIFYDLISSFHRLTGVPILLNTSLNLNGEPIVANPTDAIRSFSTSGMDCLVIGRFLLEK